MKCIDEFSCTGSGLEKGGNSGGIFSAPLSFRRPLLDPDPEKPIRNEVRREN